jgi:hypothetical protein
MKMSPKIWTLIAGASLGLLMSAACTVTSVDDDGTTGVGGGTTTTTTTTTTSNGGNGGGGVGGGGTCAGCGDYLYAQSEDEICGGEVIGGDLFCDEGSSCELLVDLFICACENDGSGSGACETECAGTDGLCGGYVPSTGCENCLAAGCAGEFGSCSAD